MILRNPSIHGKTVVKNECAASDLITGEDSPTLGFGSLWCLPRETWDNDDVANGKLVLEPKAPCESELRGIDLLKHRRDDPSTHKDTWRGLVYKPVHTGTPFRTVLGNAVHALHHGAAIKRVKCGTRWIHWGQAFPLTGGQTRSPRVWTGTIPPSQWSTSEQPNCFNIETSNNVINWVDIICIQLSLQARLSLHRHGVLPQS